MKYRSIKFMSCLVAFAALAMVTYSCAEDDTFPVDHTYPTGGDEEVEESLSVESITLNYEEYTMNLEGSLTLTARLDPLDAEVQSVTWSSSDESVATVSETGVVTPVAYGTATITVKTDEAGSDVSAECVVTVSADYVAVSSLTFSNAKTAFSPEGEWLYVHNANAGTDEYGTYQIVYEFNKYVLKPILAEGESYDDFSDEDLEALDEDDFEWVAVEDLGLTQSEPTVQTISWTSSDIAVASVENGLITAKGAGTAEIYAVSLENASAIDTCFVTVKTAAVEGISFISVVDDAELQRGGSVQLLVEFDPVYATDRDCTYTDFDSNYISVDADGVVTAKSAYDLNYNATQDVAITVASVSVSRHTMDYTVTINPADVTEVALSASQFTVGIDATLSLLTSYTPSYAGNTDLEYKSSNEAVATVSAVGVVTGVAAGEVSITAVNTYTGVESNVVTITVVDAGAFAIDPAFDGMVYPQNEGSVQMYLVSGTASSWESSDTFVATVGSGLVTFKGLGEVTITAKAADATESSVTISIPAGFWRETYATVESNLTNYVYAVNTFNHRTAAGLPSYPVAVADAAGNYIEVPTSTPTATSKQYYFASQQYDEIGIHENYGYLAVHTENILWKNYLENGTKGTASRLCIHENNNRGASYAYKSSRSDASIIYVFENFPYVTDAKMSDGTTYYDAEPADEFSEFIVGGTYTSGSVTYSNKMVIQTAIEIDGVVSPAINLYGISTFKTAEDVEAWAKELGSNGYKVENISVNYSTLDPDGASNSSNDYWTRVNYSNGSSIKL